MGEGQINAWLDIAGVKCLASHTLSAALIGELKTHPSGKLFFVSFIPTAFCSRDQKDELPCGCNK